MTNSRILVCDDDHEVVLLMRGYLEMAGFEVLTAYNGDTAFQMMRSEKPDLLLIDLMMPGKDGMEVTRLIRSDPKICDTPIIMLTAKVDEPDRIIGLEMGADDYITKPYSPREVVARVKARLRNFGTELAQKSRQLETGGIYLNMDYREVTIDGEPIELTNTEFKLLSVFMEDVGHVFTREQLIDKALGSSYEGIDRTLDSHIRNLRKKIEKDSRKPNYLHTIYGVGYRFNYRKG
ncbi:MAG: response regulator transcription factor [Chloroflexota bacterium]